MVVTYAILQCWPALSIIVTERAILKEPLLSCVASIKLAAVCCLFSALLLWMPSM